MNVSEEIRHKIDDVAANKLSVWAFEQWLEPLSWSMHRDLAPDDVRLIGAIQSLFDSFDHEGADESVLRRELAALSTANRVLRVRIIISADQIQRVVIPASVSSSSSQIDRVPEIWVPEPVAAGY